MLLCYDNESFITCLVLVTVSIISICFFLQQSVDELISMAHKFYDEVALPKLVTLHFSKDFTFVLITKRL